MLKRAIVTVLLVSGVSGRAQWKGPESDEENQRRVALQAKFTSFPVVAVNTQKNAIAFQQIDLTPSATRVGDETIYAFRFRTPAERGALYWAYKVPWNRFKWGMFRSFGTMIGFTSRAAYPLPDDIPGYGPSGYPFAYQTTYEGNLEPNADYCVWIRFSEEDEKALLFSLNVFPTQPGPAYAICPAWLYSRPAARYEVEDEEERRLREAMQARFLAFPAVAVNTQALAISFSEVDLSPSAVTVDGVLFHAFRFRAPPEPGALYWAFKKPARGVEWQVYPSTGTLNVFLGSAEKSLPVDVPGVGRKGESFIFQSVSEKSLQPDLHYWVLVRFPEGVEPTLFLSVNVLPPQRGSSYKVFPEPMWQAPSAP